MGRQIDTYFPDRNLTKVSSSIIEFAERHTADLHVIDRPNRYIQLLIGSAMSTMLALVMYWMYELFIHNDGSGMIFELQDLDAFINILIFGSAATWFLLNWQAKSKRSFIIHRINELRSFAHVIDMHQLTKDPFFDDEMDMSDDDLIRYLDYCGDLLSCCSKLAATYLEHTDDEMVVQCVNEFESLTGRFNRKIWQKITILDRKKQC
jgi:hypothetical protein